MADTEALVTKLAECAEKLDFEGAFKLVRENQGEFAKSLQPVGVKDALKKKEVITFNEKDEPVVLDPLFEYWISRYYFEIAE